MELPNPELVFALDSTPYLKGILRIEMGCGSEATKSRRVNWGCAGWRRGSYLSGSARSAFVPLLHLSRKAECLLNFLTHDINDIIPHHHSNLFHKLRWRSESHARAVDLA